MQSLDVRETALSDSDIQCFNITTTLRELLLECPSNLREPVYDDSNKDSTDDEGSNNDTEDDDIHNNPLKSFDSESILSTSEEENNANGDSDSDDDDDDDNDQPDDNVQAEAAPPQNHFIHVFVRNGNMEDVNNDTRMRELNNLRYMVGVLNGTGAPAVLQRQLQEREEEQAQIVASTNQSNNGVAGPSTSQASLTPSTSQASPSTDEPSGSTASGKPVAATSSSASSSSPLAGSSSNEVNQNKPNNVEPQAGSSAAMPNNNAPPPNEEIDINQIPTRQVHHVIIRQIPPEGENTVYRDR